MDVLALVLHFKRLAVVALALADIAGHVHVGQEVHLDLDQAVALTGLAAAALDVEAEAARLVAAGACFLGAGEQLANRREDAGIGRRIGARRPPDGALVDIHHLVEQVQPFDGAVGRGRQGGGPIELTRRQWHQGGIDQRRLARARDPGDARQQACRQRQRHILQVVAGGTGQAQHLVRVGRKAVGRHGDLALATQVLPGQ